MGGYALRDELSAIGEVLKGGLGFPSFGDIFRGLLTFGAGELGLETRRAPPRLVVLKPFLLNSSIRSAVMYHLLPFPGS